MSATRLRIGIGDIEVPVPSHVCLFYSDEDELRERLGFATAGLERAGEVAVLFGPRSRLDEVLGYIAADHGVDVDAALGSGRIVLVEGDRDVPGIVGNVTAALDGVVARGARLIRFLGFIGWREQTWPSDPELLAFEAAVNEAVLAYPAVIVCTYGMRRVDGNVLLWSGLGTHPYTILGDVVCENPHYVPYERFEQARASGDRSWLRGITLRGGGSG